MIRTGSTKTQEINLVSLYFPFLLRNYIFSLIQMRTDGIDLQCLIFQNHKD